MKKVVVTSIETNRFIQELETLIKLGATFTEGCVAVRRPHLSVELMISEDVFVETNPWVRVIPTDKSKVVDKVEIVKPKTKAVKVVKATKKKEDIKEDIKEDK